MSFNIAELGGGCMNAGYLRGLAKRCYAAAHGCFDLHAKEEFRLLGDELRQKAEELEGVRLPQIMLGRPRPTAREDERN